MWQKGLLLCGFVWVQVAANAQGLAPTLHPERFCFLGAKMGLPTGAFSKADMPGCSSPPKSVSPGLGRTGLANTLAFYSFSDFDKVERLQYLSLILNVNNPGEVKEAYGALLPAAKSLSSAVLGEVPVDLEKAVLAGQNKTWKMKGWRVELKRKDFAPASNGHQVTYRLYPNG
jgi:hypothetical protein